MKNFSSDLISQYLTRDEMRIIQGGSEIGGGSDTCNYTTGCTTRCKERKLINGKLEWICTYCCVAV